MADQKKNGHALHKKDEKPWEKMYSGKNAKGGSETADKKSATKKETTVKKENTKKASEFLDFLYLLPKRTSAKELSKTIDFLPKSAIEVWEEECVIEITTTNGTITFEDIRDSLGKEDEKVLSDLRMKQVISCDYEASDRETVRKVMKAFLDKFGGKIGTDTEDFTPFLSAEEL